MELYQLQSFLAVVRNGSLSRAAASRHISLPGISKHIKMLEESFGFPLFFRTVRGMELTEEGQQILKHVERIQNEVHKLNALARRQRPIRIGFNIAPDFLELYQLQQLLVDHHPDSEITLTNHNSGILLTRLQKDELDLCLAFGPVPTQLLHLPICQVAMVLMVPASLGDGPVDLNEQCWIVNTDD
jgi:DNA-binding transcriptional LysR family regulator